MDQWGFPQEEIILGMDALAERLRLKSSYIRILLAGGGGHFFRKSATHKMEIERLDTKGESNV